MFNIGDLGPLSFRTFLNEKFSSEFNEWTIATMQAAAPKPAEEAPPFDLARSIEEAEFQVWLTVKHSKHGYSPLPENHPGLSQGFVTLEGWSSFVRLSNLDLGLIRNHGILTCNHGGSGFVRALDGNGVAQWTKLESPNSRLWCFLVSTKHVPKFLRRFIREFSM